MRISLVVLSNISITLLVLIMLCSMKPWFVWNSGISIYIALSIFVMFRMFLSIYKLTFTCAIAVGLCILLYTVLDIPHIVAFKNLLEYVLRHVLFVSLLILMTLHEKQKTIKWLINAYVTILAISIVLYVLYLLGLNIPSYPVLIDDPYYSWGFVNYLFLIVPNSLMDFRFQSIFLEPGHVGMISSLLLYCMKYTLKDVRGVILLLSVILSFSLAAYLLLFIGLIIYKSTIMTNLWSYFLKIFLALVSAIVFSTFFYKKFPDTIFSELIIGRLEYDAEKGFSGNNRTTYEFDKYYKKFYTTNVCLLGEGYKLAEKIPGGGYSSYKVFIVSHGLFGIIFLFIFFCFFAYKAHSRFVWGLLLLYMISFWQRPYALWEIELVPFIFISQICQERRCKRICE